MTTLLKISKISSCRLILIIILSGFFVQVQGVGIEKTQPTELSINFLTYADQVYLNGYAVQTPLYQAVSQNENFQFTEIAQKQPFFGWVVNSAQPI